MDDDSVVREVLEDVVTTVCGDSRLFRPFQITSRPRRRRWRSASPVNTEITNGSSTNDYCEPKREKIKNRNDSSCSPSILSPKKNHTGNNSSSSGMLLSDSSVNVSKSRSRSRHDDSQSSITDGTRKVRKRKRSRSGSRSRTRSPSIVDDVYACNVCNDEFRRPQVLCHHLYRNHQLPSCCAYCNKHFYDTTLLMKHIKTAHVGRTSFDCWFCSSKPSGMRIFWDHMWRFHKKNMFRCRCGQICFSLHCFHAHQALCTKLKIKSFHDVRCHSTLGANVAGANKQPPPINKIEINNKRRQDFFRPYPKLNEYQQKRNIVSDRACEKVENNQAPFMKKPPMQVSSQIWATTPIFPNDNSISPPIYPTDNVLVPPNNFYPFHTTFGFNPILKDPRIMKKLNNEYSAGKSVEESKVPINDKPRLPEIQVPVASSTPVMDVKISSVQILRPNVSSQISVDCSQIEKIASPPKNVDSGYLKPHWLPLASMKGCGDFNPTSDRKTILASSISPVDFARASSFSNIAKLPNLSKNHSSLTSTTNVLSCGCKSGSMNHMCDILKDLKEEIDMAEKSKQEILAVPTSARIQVDSFTVTESKGTDVLYPMTGNNVQNPVVGSHLHNPIASNNLHNPMVKKSKEDNIDVATASVKICSNVEKKKSPESSVIKKPVEQKNLKISTKNLAKLRAKVKTVKDDDFTSPPRKVGKKDKLGIVDLTSPTKKEAKEKNVKQGKIYTNQRSAKILLFTKVEELHQKLGAKIFNKDVPADQIAIKTEPIDDNNKKDNINAKQKGNRKNSKTVVVDGTPMTAKQRSDAKIEEKAEPGNNVCQQPIVVAAGAVKDMKLQESYIPPKKRWASEFVESAKCLEKQTSATCSSTSTAATSSSERIETEFQCDLCDYRCSKKKSMEKHLIKKHCLSVSAERYANFYNTYEVCKTVVAADEMPPLGNRENVALSAKFDNLRQEVDLLKQCLNLMKPEMNR